MGNIAGVYASKIIESNDELKEKIQYIYFQTKSNVFASDHFNREEMENFENAVPILDRTILLFNISVEDISSIKYLGGGRIQKMKGEWVYWNEVNLREKEAFFIFCSILPKNFIPTNYYSAPEPHFAKRIDDNIRITWWFPRQAQIRFGFKKDPKAFRDFSREIRVPFFERHTRLRLLKDKAESLSIKVVSDLLREQLSG